QCGRRRWGRPPSARSKPPPSAPLRAESTTAPAPARRPRPCRDVFTLDPTAFHAAPAATACARGTEATRAARTMAPTPSVSIPPTAAAAPVARRPATPAAHRGRPACSSEALDPSVAPAASRRDSPVGFGAAGCQPGAPAEALPSAPLRDVAPALRVNIAIVAAALGDRVCGWALTAAGRDDESPAGGMLVLRGCAPRSGRASCKYYHAPDRRPRVRPLPGNCSGDHPWSGAVVDHAVAVRVARMGSAPPTCRGRRLDPGGRPDPSGVVRAVRA